MQNLKNEVESLKRKLELTETKFNIKIKELKEKDNFIVSTVIGRSRQEDVPYIVAEFQRIFEADYVNKLAETNEKIKNLQKPTKKMIRIS